MQTIHFELKIYIYWLSVIYWTVRHIINNLDRPTSTIYGLFLIDVQGGRVKWKMYVESRVTFSPCVVLWILYIKGLPTKFTQGPSQHHTLKILGLLTVSTGH